MNIEIVQGPGNAAAKVSLGASESITAESGSMIAMNSHVQMNTTTHSRGGSGGLLKAVKRMFAGESFFLNHYTAGHDGGDVYLSTPLPGDMLTHELNDENLIVQARSFVACADGVDVDLGWQGFKSLLSGESMFWIHLKGSGEVVLNSFGAIYPIEVDGDVLVDTGHIVAFQDTLDFSITKAGKSWLHSFMGGEGLVCKFHGTGTVWCQSHNPPSFGGKLGPLLKRRPR